MGLSFIKPDTNINFIGVRRIAYAVSLTLILLGLAALILRGGPRYGIDFAGGIIVQAKIEAKHEVGFDAVQEALKGVELPGLAVQSMLDETDEYLIRTSTSDLDTEAVKRTIQTALEQHIPDSKVEIRRTEMVGPKVSSDLRAKALEAMFYAVLLITIYISGRFEQRWMAAAIMAAALFGGISVLEFAGAPVGWLIFGALIIALALCWFMKLNYALGAVVALVHDVLIT
ncbi:MAG: protein translocase subunit SecF, partial [Desulfovibrionaceae bacterium]